MKKKTVTVFLLYSLFFYLTVFANPSINSGRSEGVPPQYFDILMKDSCLNYGDTAVLFVTPTDSHTVYKWEIPGGNTFTGGIIQFKLDSYGYYCVKVTAKNKKGESNKRKIFFVNPPVFCCDSVIPDSVTVFHDGYVLQPGDIRDGNSYVAKGDLILPANSKESWKNVVIKFFPKGRLVVDDARLKTESCVFTSFCKGTMWQGIEIRSSKGTNDYVEIRHTTIRNAHIGILAGKRNFSEICEDTTFNLISKGGYLKKVDRSIFDNNGIGIYFYPEFQNKTEINHTLFYTTVLNDSNYYNGRSTHYPNARNPWLPGDVANSLMRGYAGIYARNMKNLMIYGKGGFLHMEYGIRTINSSSFVRYNYFRDLSYGIYHSGHYNNLGHKIIANEMRDIFKPDFYERKTSAPGAIIYIENSTNDLIRRTNYEPYEHGPNTNGIVLKNSTDFKIVQGNDIRECLSAVIIDNCKRGYIGADMQPETKYPLPNVFKNNKIGIELYGDNSGVVIKYNKFKVNLLYDFVSNIYNHAIIDDNGKTKNLKLAEEYAAYNLFPVHSFLALINKDIHVFTSPFFLTDFAENNILFNFVRNSKTGTSKVKMKDTSMPVILKENKRNVTFSPASIFFRNIYPNPFDKQVTVNYDMPEGLDAELKVFDSKGRLIYSKEIPAGEGKLDIPAKNWQSGTYLCSVYVEGELIETHKLIKQ